MTRLLLTLLAVTTGIALGVESLAAQGLPPCTAGFQAPIVCCTNYPGTILAVDNENATYQVRQHNNQVEWLGASMLKRSCTGLQPRAVAADYFTGKWSMFIPPYPKYEVLGGRNYLVVPMGAKAFHIDIKGDGTYSWLTVTGANIAGRWRVLQPNEFKYGTAPNNAPVLLIMQGEAGADWYISRKGTNFANVQQIHVEQMRMGLTQSGTRMQPSGTSGQNPGAAPSQATVDYSQPIPARPPGSPPPDTTPLGSSAPITSSTILVR